MGSGGSRLQHWRGPFSLERAWPAEFAPKGVAGRKFFPNVHLLLKTLAILPVITAEAEKLFSKLNNTLSAVISTMTEGRRKSLLLIQVHPERTPSVEKIIESFASLKSRKLTLCDAYA